MKNSIFGDTIYIHGIRFSYFQLPNVLRTFSSILESTNIIGNGSLPAERIACKTVLNGLASVPSPVSSLPYFSDVYNAVLT